MSKPYPRIMPADNEVVAAILANNNAVFGVPNKAEIFRIAVDGNRNEKVSRVKPPNKWLKLQIVKVIGSSFTVASPPDIDTCGTGIHELNYTIQAQVLCTEMALTRIRVVHGSRTDNSKSIVFEADEYPGARDLHQLRTIRVTVDDNGRATYEVITSTILSEPDE